MLTVLVWKDAQSFRQHLEHMRVFRQSHHGNRGDELSLLKDMPHGDTLSLSKTGGARGFISKPYIVPMWEIVLPKISQN